jgi:hypothetical protein
MVDKQTELDALLKISSLGSFSEQESLDILQKLVDHSFDLKTNIGTNHAIALIKNIDFNKKFPTQQFLAHYFISIAWSDLRGNKVHTSEAWEWEQPELEQEVVNIRLAARYYNPGHDAPERICQILSNLGISMAWMGRFAIAYEYWNSVNSITDRFGPAIGSLGDNMIYQALNALYDEGHQKVFFVIGYKNLARAVKLPLEDDAKIHYQQKLESIESSNPQLKAVDLELDTSEYSSAQDAHYRKWCLSNCLFLNPLNDIGEYQIATCDPLSLPTMNVSVEEGGSYHSFFNQIKQEYVSARFVFYDNLKKSDKHFSDDHVMKYDLLDSTRLSLHTEMKKLSFRMAYSIFDKIAFFLNFYLKLKIPETKVNFKTLWFDKQQSVNGLRAEFSRRANLSFRALYWLGKDIHVHSEAYRDSLDPTTFDLARIRNFIEHKNFRIFNDGFNSPPEILKDKTSYSIDEKHFDEKTLKLLKLAREAIIYLCLGINREEKNRSEQEASFPVHLKIKL